ncbi:serine hydrolase domain-containing protein [Streptomyces chartreusis]|uniref:Beta-lactamase family protein n=1 Tax=Streptomyces chartreusis TaxID=1969 RepID=A0A7H8T2C4_STRCX|nr:serine hydrolase domain-containing protein [Streptomyces chartreusis]QKZ17607.1 beta-lactamase family protein [Streptomyces chartreusis]
MTSSKGVAQQIDGLLAARVERGDVPGVAALAANAGGVTYRGAFGARRGAEPWTVDTVAWIASMTKVITSVAALQLVERDQLSLDDPLGGLIPQLAEPKVLEGFDTNGRPRLRPAATAVTLRNLLSHTAGYAYHFWNADVKRYQETEGLPGIIECREATLATPLVFDPGTKWEYGTNTEWVGKVVEAVSGQRLEDYLRGHILDPLGMSSTSFVISADHRTRLAGMTARTPDGLVPIEFEIPQDPEFQMGGGGMYGSPADFLTFLRMLLGNGTLNGIEILRPDTMAEAARNQIGDLTMGEIKTVDPASSNDIDLMPEVTKKWSLLGMLNVEETKGGRSPGSLFWAGLANCYYWVDWAKGNTGVVFTQILPFGDRIVLDLFEEFENAVRGA